MSHFVTRIWKLAPREHGQALILFAAGLAGLCGLVGMGVDVGNVAYTKTDLQKVADAAVMAAAQDLPSATNATSSAQSYVTKNGGGTATVSVTASVAGGGNDTVQVTVTRRVNYTFLKVIGLSGANPSATAKAAARSYTGGTGIMPLGLLASGLQNGKVHNNCYQGSDGSGMPTFSQNIPCMLHDGASDCSPGSQCTGGDFGELALDGSGGNDYRNALANGSTKPYKAGDQVDTQTGNQVGPTIQGLQEHLAKTPPPGCGTQAQSLTTDGNGKTSIKPGCEGDPHIWIVPVVNQFNNPQKSTIIGFAFMWVDGVQTKGGHMQLSGKFITFVTALKGGNYSGSASGSGSATAVRLVQ